MKKSINDITMEASYMLFAYVAIVSEMIQESTGLGVNEADAMGNIMFQRKIDELKDNINSFEAKKLEKYIAECKCHLFGEDEKNE